MCFNKAMIIYEESYITFLSFLTEQKLFIVIYNKKINKNNYYLYYINYKFTNNSPFYIKKNNS